MATNIHPLSLVSVPLIINSGPTKMAEGTVFFYKYRDAVYLVTNRHNLCGKMSGDGKLITASPDNISICSHSAKNLGDWTVSNPMPLYNKDGEASWLQHPVYGNKVDVAVMKIDVASDCKIYSINEIAKTENMSVGVGQDVFVLGFPIRRFTGIFPTWKRASVATEPGLNIDNVPMFLIDTATREGMSGSPIVTHQRGYIDEKTGAYMRDSIGMKFLGVYSGRFGADKIEEAQLGICWRKELVEEIIQAGVPGSCNC